MNAVCCPHPGVNRDDDYSPVVCCMCDGNDCPAVTEEQKAEHGAVMAQLDPEAQRYIAQAQVIVQIVEEYEAAHAPNAPCFNDALESMRQRAAS